MSRTSDDGGSIAPSVSNWGRWGDHDQVGTPNLIDADAIRRGLAAVRTARQFGLSLPLQSGKVPVWPERERPMHFMTVDGGDYAAGAPSPGGLQIADDYVFMPCQSGTHIDALCHVFSEDRMYNGWPSDEVRSYGARACGVERMPAIVTRGVLLDIAASKGVEHLEPGYPISGDDLDECARQADVEIQPGDAVLVRTGWMERLLAGVDPRDGEPGLGLRAVPWCAERQVSVVGTDTHGAEVSPVEREGDAGPVHIELLRNQGLPLIELLVLAELAEHGTREFLFVAAPLRIKGATGSPINPIAIT